MKYNFRDNIENMEGYTPGFQPSDPAAIKLNTNENPYAPSPRVFEALGKLSALDMQRYPRVFWDKFREVAARLHGVEPEMIIGGNGADELLTMLVRCCCDSGRPLAYPVLSYSLYPVLATIQDCPKIETPFPADYSLPAKLADTGAALTILCNPNAPTATFISIEDIADLAEEIDGVLAIDEAYVDFSEDNCVRLLKRFNNIIILRSMSKGYSLAGMRFGYGLGAPRIIEAMIKVKDSYNVNVATQAVATAALADQDYFRQNVKKIKIQRDRLTHELRALGFDVPESHTNFLLARTKRLAAREIHEKLTQHNIYIRYFDIEGLQDRLRISVGSAEQNDALLSALQDILK
ncbi:MAG: histidinol-phosphate transaminase [Sedimentisphaerales bacterium]|nr:histidinol-phosphate transaminase [Sedimentisphaerales bacterium]